jgi:predicted dehydrogenase
MPRFLSVGIIGVGVDRGWARKSHAPAVQKLTRLRLATAATNSPATADASARTFDTTAYGHGAAPSAKVA